VLTTGGRGGSFQAAFDVFQEAQAGRSKEVILTDLAEFVAAQGVSAPDEWRQRCADRISRGIRVDGSAAMTL